MGRRAAGEGSIYPIRDKDGKIVKYAASISLGFTDGKRNRKKVERRTRKEVAEEIAALKLQQSKGVNLTTKQPTVREYCMPWLHDTFVLKARPRSVESYRQMFEYYIFPIIGDMKVKAVLHRHTQKLVSDMHKNDYADKTIGLVRAAGRQAFAAAMREGLTDHNPFQGLTLPTGNGKKAITLTVEQARAFLLAIRGYRLEVALRLMLSLGLRRGEVCGLRWGLDVDLKAGTLTVNGTLQYIRGHGLVWGDPKTDTSRRSFKLPPTLIAALVWHQAEQERERKKMGKLWNDSGYVFVSPTNGGPLNSNAIYEAFKRAAGVAELPIEASPHTLRHSCASFLHAEGASIKKISVYLGHSNTNITNNIYVHLFQDEIDDGVVTVENLLAREA